MATVEHDDEPAWRGTARNPALLVIAAALLVLGLASLLTEAAPAVAPLVLAAAAMGSFSSAEVLVDRRTVQVRSLPLGWPRVAIPIAAVEAVSAVDVRPLTAGGWGYRGSLRLFRRAAWVLRRGPGLELALAGGRRFTVTVDDADAGAAALRRLL